MIGANVIILPNTKIGSNVIIRSGAVGTKYIPDNSIVVGVPCKIISNFEDFCQKRKKIQKFLDVDFCNVHE